MVTTGSWTGSRIRAAAAASLITLLGGCGGSGNTSGDSSGGGYGSTGTTSSLGCSDVAGASATVLARINALRAVARQCGSTRFAAAGALSWSSTLASAAQAHASDMARSNYFDHTGLDGSTPASRARRPCATHCVGACPGHGGCARSGDASALGAARRRRF